MASLIGTTIEWYDFFLYGSAAALVFNKLFFPEFDPLTGTLLAFATYALGFVARPVGGIVFGHFGDRIGRKRLLMLSLVLMGVATVLIGLLPTYAQIGIWAPLALIALRLVQGFAVGGEWGGAVLMAAEHGDAARRGFWASWPQAGVPAGNLLAAAVLALMAGGPDRGGFPRLGLARAVRAVGAAGRGRLVHPQPRGREPDVREGARRGRGAAEGARDGSASRAAEGAGARRGPARRREHLLLHPHRLLADLSGRRRRRRAGASRSTRLLIGAAVQFFAIPCFALLSDRIGRRPVYAFGAFGLAAWCFVMFGLLGSGDNASIVLALVVGLVLHGAMYGPQAAFITELFPTRIRYSGVSLAYQLTSIVAGSLAPIIALWLYKEYGSATPVAIYVGVACLISGVSALARARDPGPRAGSDPLAIRPGGSAALCAPVQLVRIEIDLAQIAGRVALRLVVEMGRGGSPLSPPAVTARARTRLPNSTTATKLLPLVPYHFFVPGFGRRAERGQRAPARGREGDGDARRGIAERMIDRGRDALEAIDFAPRHLPPAEVAAQARDSVARARPASARCVVSRASRVVVTLIGSSAGAATAFIRLSTQTIAIDWATEPALQR